MTIPIHLDQTCAVLKEQQDAAAISAARRKEQEQVKAQQGREKAMRLAQKERDLQAKVAEEYTVFVSGLNLESKETAGSPRRSNYKKHKQGLQREYTSVEQVLFLSLSSPSTTWYFSGKSRWMWTNCKLQEVNIFLKIERQQFIL
jgi:hypothetical protein